GASSARVDRIACCCSCALTPVCGGDSERHRGYSIGPDGMNLPVAESSMGVDDDSREFERFARPHAAAALRLARTLVRNEADAQDVLQDSFLRAFRHFRGFSGESPRAWLLSIVRNVSFTLWRKRERDDPGDGGVQLPGDFRDPRRADRNGDVTTVASPGAAGAGAGWRPAEQELMGTFDEHPRGALHAYLDKELSLEGSLEVEAHLAECGACRRELETYRALRRLLQSARASAPEAESALMKVTRSVRM